MRPGDETFRTYREIMAKNVVSQTTRGDDPEKKTVQLPDGHTVIMGARPERATMALELLYKDEAHVRGAPKFEISNIYRYMDNHDPKSLPDIHELPCIAPPFSTYWMEGVVPGVTVRPKSRGAILFRGVDCKENYELIDPALPQNDWLHDFRMSMESIAPLGWEPPEVRWILRGTIYTWSPESGKAHGPLGDHFSLLDADGRVIQVPDSTSVYNRLYPEGYPDQNKVTGNNFPFTNPLPMLTFGYPHDPGVPEGVIQKIVRGALFATSLLHCRNVSVEDRELFVPRPSARKRKQSPGGRARKGRMGRIRYHILDVPVGKKPDHATTREQEEEGAGVAFHVVRGHYKDYRHGPGLGRSGVKGIWYWGAHVRGSRERGVVVKDYQEKGEPSE